LPKGIPGKNDVARQWQSAGYSSLAAAPSLGFYRPHEVACSEPWMTIRACTQLQSISQTLNEAPQKEATCQVHTSVAASYRLGGAGAVSLIAGAGEALGRPGRRLLCTSCTSYRRPGWPNELGDAIVCGPQLVPGKRQTPRCFVYLTLNVP
jgi:hypothetical protein